MQHFDSYDEWELDMIAGGDWPDPVSDDLLAYARTSEGVRFEESLRLALHRAGCPSTLTLATWKASLLAPDEAAATSAHVAHCAACESDVAALETETVAPPLGEQIVSGLRHFVLRLVRSLPSQDTATPAYHASRGGGAQWVDNYVAEPYSLSLVVNRSDQGPVLTGGLLGGEWGATASLWDGKQLVERTTLDEEASFSLRYPPRGRYDLVIQNGRDEIVIPDLEITD